MHPARPDAAPTAGPVAPIPELPLRPPAHRASPRAVTWWRLRAAAGALVLVVPALGLLLVSGGAGWAVALLAGTAVAGVAYVVAVPPWLYRISRWEVTDHAVYTLHGWLVREWRIAPISAGADRRHRARPAPATARAGHRHRDDRVRAAAPSASAASPTTTPPSSPAS